MDAGLDVGFASKFCLPVTFSTTLFSRKHLQKQQKSTNSWKTYKSIDQLRFINSVKGTLKKEILHRRNKFHTISLKQMIRIH